MEATIDDRVVERPRGGHRFFKAQNFSLVVKAWLNWRLGGTLSEKWRQLVGKIREWVCDKPTPPKL
jgi:hypothetical protein